MNENQLKLLLTELHEHSISIEDAVEKLRHLPYEDLGYAKVDHHRMIRQGLPEVIYGASKTPEQLIGIIQRMQNQDTPLLVTRLNQEQWERIQPEVTTLEYNSIGRIAFWKETPLPKLNGTIVILCAGTSDLPIVEEARVTAELMGNPVHLLQDVGVAGLHRLLAHRTILESASVIIVVAGMEGALASVVGGLVAAPIIAVPTSVGYGAHLDGIAPLLAMLNSCAPSVVTVNIDNGFGAAYAATLINRKTGYATS